MPDETLRSPRPDAGGHRRESSTVTRAAWPVRRAATIALGLLATATIAITACTSRNTAARVTVPAGASFAQVTDSLAARDVIGSRIVFKLLARVRHVDRSVHAGV